MDAPLSTRLRENMKALKGSSEEKLLVQRYTQQLNDQQTRLEKLGKEIDRIFVPDRLE